MKPIHAAILLMAGLLTLITSPLQAQEKPADKNPNSAEETPLAEPPTAGAAEADKDKKKDKEPEAKAERAEAEKPRQERSRRPATAKPNEKLMPFIGVLTRPASPELRAQLGLPEGFGLQVVEVMPGSPAQTAGLKEHDVLVNFDDQKLVAMEQLQALVRSKKKGDQANLAVISGGKQTQITVTLDERMMPEQPSEEGRRPMGQFFQPHPQRGSSSFHDGLRTHPNLENLQSRLREYQERIQEWSRNGNRGPMPTPPMMDEGKPRAEGDRRPETHRGTERTPDDAGKRNIAVTRRDDSGMYTLRQDGDMKIFTVQPNGGSQQMWSFDDGHRDVVPEEHRDKLRMLETMVNDMGRQGRDGEGGRPPRGSPEGNRPANPEGQREREGQPTRRGETF